MPARSRGWTLNPRQSKAFAFANRGLSSAGRQTRATKGAVVVKRASRVEQLADRGWLNVAPGFPGPQTEWAIYWYLSLWGVEPRRRKLRLTLDYWYQKAVTAPGLFATKPFFRADFVIPHLGLGRRGVVLDPETPFTHPDPKDDARKREILAGEGWQWVAIDAPRLRDYPGDVVELALHGIDVSRRGRAAQANG